MIFASALFVLCTLCALLMLLMYLYSGSNSCVHSTRDAGFQQFQCIYIAVYLLAMASDWLQGPYVYALYDHYGMSSVEIQQLFVVGFGSSLVFGTAVGSFADKYGRRTNCVVYGFLYTIACITKHFNNFYVLMIGRFLGGIATSILYSAFESWMVCEHDSRGYSKELIGTVFYHATLGNSVVAIAAGMVAQVCADRFGFVSPFDISMCVLLVMIVVISIVWTENYGNPEANVGRSFRIALTNIQKDRKVLCLGLIQSLFEGAMYTFVLEWTPALRDTKVPADVIPHGWIFASFMVAVMIGSSVFKLLSRFFSVESFMRPVLLISALSLCVFIFIPESQSGVYLGFLAFECCVGIFWPAMGTMRGKYVPEEARSTIMNFFRIPLNLIVIVILLQNLSMRVMFQFCVVFLVLAAAVQHWLFRLSQVTPTTIT